MTRIRLAALAMGLVLGLGSSAFAQLAKDAAIAKSEAILRNLQKDAAAAVVKEFNPKMAQAMSADTLGAVWVQLTSQFGALKSIDERRDGQLQGYQAVELMLTFEKEKLVQRTVFDADGKVAGLAFLRAALALLPAAK
jgi:hypothetical protein